MSRERVCEGDERFRERNPNPWVMATRRKLKRTPSSPSAQKTCFIDFLPPTINLHDLSAIFCKYGTIANIYIPEKLRPNKSYRYAFIKFISISSLQPAMRGENGKRMGNYIMRIYPAKHDKLNHNPYPEPTRTQTYNKNNNHTYPRKPNSYPSRDHRSYREVCLNQNQRKPEKNQPQPNTIPVPRPKTPNPPNHNPKKQHIPPNEPNIQPDCFMFEPCAMKRMSARARSEETEAVRDELIVKSMEGEEFMALKGSPCNLNDELYQRSAIAFANSPLSSNAILDHILSQKE